VGAAARLPVQPNDLDEAHQAVGFPGRRHRAVADHAGFGGGLVRGHVLVTHRKVLADHVVIAVSRGPRSRSLSASGRSKSNRAVPSAFSCAPVTSAPWNSWKTRALRMCVLVWSWAISSRKAGSTAASAVPEISNRGREEVAELSA
jgi:hypothetical protein